jgi:hypothetical protein
MRVPSPAAAHSPEQNREARRLYSCTDMGDSINFPALTTF